MTEGRTKLAPDNRWFSNALGPSFESGYQRELLEFICGERLGAGMSREVFRFALDDEYVIKFESIEHRFQNVEEMMTWQAVEHTRFAKWFAPCKAISGCGRILLQRYAAPIAASNLPKEIPAFFTDTKPGNWGLIGKQPVAMDYGRTMLMSRGLSNAMRKAQWT